MKDLKKTEIGDKQIEMIMGNLLRFGVLLSAIIVLAGGFIYLWQHGTSTPQYSTFAGEPKRLREIGRIWSTAFNGRGRSVIQLGLLILISTPIARILFSIIGFILEKDILYTMITLFVLLIIIVSLF